ncbi:transposase [Streptomyces sp. NPDC004059]
MLHRLITAGQWQEGDPDVLVIADAGYGAPRLAFLLQDLPVQVLARMRSERGRAPGCSTPPATHDGPPTPARRRIRLRAARYLGRPGHRDCHRHTSLRHRQGPLLGPAAPQAQSPLLLGHRRRHSPGRRGDGDPPGHRRNTEAGLAVVVGHRRHCGGRRPSLAGLPAAL